MQVAAIAYGNGKLEARERNDVWTVRLANLEARASYLDLALAKLLGDAPEAHRAAARLLVGGLVDVVEQQEAAHSQIEPAPRRVQGSAPPHQPWAKPLLLGLRVFLFAVVASTAFMLTTWLTALR
jgi:hypothetical protein